MATPPSGVGRQRLGQEHPGDGRRDRPQSAGNERAVPTPVALSALYPMPADEKRLPDAMLLAVPR